MAAKFTYKGFDEYFGKLKTISGSNFAYWKNKWIKPGLYDGAGIMADEIYARCPVNSGALRESLFIDRFAETDDTVFTVIGFAGYDENGTSNQMKANVLESGRSSSSGVTGKHPFVRDAFKSVKEKAERAIADKIEEQIDKIMEE